MNIVRRERKIQYVIKSYQKCRPASAWKLARGVEAGTVAHEACALCLCDESLMLLSENVTLKDAHTNLHLTLRQLVQQLHLLPADTSGFSTNIGASLQKICKTCVNRLSSFFLFSKKCLKTGIALNNIEKIIQNKKQENSFKRRDKKITKADFPFEDIYEYVENRSKQADEKKNNENVLPEHPYMHNAGLDPDNKHIVHNILEQNSIQLKMDEEVRFNCKSYNLHTASWLECTRQQVVHSCEKLIRNILQNKPFCICCLKGTDDLVGVSQQIIFNGLNDLNFSLSLSTILYKIFDISIIETYSSAQICEICIEQTIRSYHFKNQLAQSSSAIKKCINNLENSLNQTTADSTKLSSGTKLKIYINNLNEETVDVQNDITKETNWDSNNFDASENSGFCGEDGEEKPVKKTVMKKKYKCLRCNKKFSSETKCKQHERMKKNCTTNCCRFCSKTFCSVKYLRSHQNSCPKTNTLVACELCHLPMQQNELKSHQNRVHHSNALICDYCNKKYYSKELLEAHILKKHLAREKQVCAECGKHFKSIIQYKSHICRYKCNECLGHQCIHIKFLTAFQKNHITNPKMQQKCVDCDFLYYHKHEIVAHSNKEHLLHYPHLCDICGQNFASKGDLKYHRNDRHKIVLHCPHCAKALKDQYLLEKHIEMCKVTCKPFKCDLCIAQFTSEEKMNFHRRKHFPRNFQCQFCQGKYWTKSELNGHLKRSHKHFGATENNANKEFQCTMCSLDFPSKKERMDHLTTSHSQESKHICRVCNASFKSRIIYYGHLKRHNIKKDTKCQICGKFYTKYNIKTHLKSHGTIQKDVKPEKINSKKNTMCDICGRLLSNQASLIKHREIHKEQEQCPNCLKFINSTFFDRHLRTHEGTGESKCRSNQRRNRKMFNCSECDYSSVFADCLEAHENRFHLQVRPFKCDICNKAFYAKITLKEHIRTHAGSKPEQCEQCGNRFVSRKALRLHVRIHTGEKPYACELCDERFLSASRRQAHRTRKHFAPSVQCHLCLKMYYTQSAVRIHLRDYHSGEPKQRGNKKKKVLN